MPFTHLPKFLRPRLRLFLSVDLVGSTALKQDGLFPIKMPDQKEPMKDRSIAGTAWFPSLLEFYQEIDSYFSRHYADLERHANGILELGYRPEIWKSNGDEIIYVKDLDHPHEVHCIIACWIKTLREYKANAVNRKESRLDVKGTIWIAGFPISNKEVIFAHNYTGRNTQHAGLIEMRNYELLDKWYSDESNRQNLVRDFMGPQIDTGFRLSQYSTGRKCMISIETAYFLAAEVAPKEYDELHLFFDGSVQLKGVLGGRPYPLFWIDTADSASLYAMEDGLVRREKVDELSIRKFCRKFFDDHKDHVLSPFIAETKKPEFGSLPENFSARLDHIYRTYQDQMNLVEKEVESTSGVHPPPEQEKELAQPGEQQAKAFVDTISFKVSVPS